MVKVFFLSLLCTSFSFLDLYFSSFSLSQQEILASAKSLAINNYEIFACKETTRFLNANGVGATLVHDPVSTLQSRKMHLGIFFSPSVAFVFLRCPVLLPFFSPYSLYSTPFKILLPPFPPPPPYLSILTGHVLPLSPPTAIILADHDADQNELYQIRRAAVDYNTPIITNLQVSQMLAESLATANKLHVESYQELRARAKMVA